MNSIRENNLVSAFFILTIISFILFFAGTSSGWSKKTLSTIIAAMWTFIVLAFFGFIPKINGGSCHPSGKPDMYRSKWKNGKCEWKD